MAVRNLKTFKPVAWIPPTSSAAHRITVETSDGTIYDITNSVLIFKVEDYVTEEVGLFEFEIYDPRGVYHTNWVGNEIVRYYKDYAATATTLRFRGRIEKPSKRGMKLNCKGRGEGSQLLTLHANKEYASVECSIILKDLLTSYAPGITQGGIEETTTYLTLSFSEKPVMDCVKELCIASGFDFYVSPELEAQFFLKGSRDNDDEAIVHDLNMISLSDFTPDNTKVRNKVKVYGALIDGTQIIHTSIQRTGQFGTTIFGVKEHIEKDDSITTYDQAKEVGDYLLSELLVPPQTGEITGILLATTKPGDRIMLSSPNDGIIPQKYVISGYQDEINNSSGEMFTTLYINKKPRKISDVIVGRIEQENREKGSNINPNGHDYAYSFRFVSDTGTHSSTEITQGALRLTSGSGSGFWTSPARQLTEDMTEAYLSMLGTSLNNAVIQVSSNGGSTYTTIPNNQKINIVAGSELVLKATISSSSTEISAINLTYK